MNRIEYQKVKERSSELQLAFLGMMLCNRSLVIDPCCTSLDIWRCSNSFATVVDEAMHEYQPPYNTTKILQLRVEPSQNDDRHSFWAT